MILNKRLLYLGENYGVHDQRFIEALKLKFDVTTFFIEGENSPSYPHDTKFDLVVVSPISAQLLNLSVGIDAIKIGICWAVEVNEVHHTELEIDQISKILKLFSLIVYDADHISNQIRTRFSYQGRMHKLYFGCNVTELVKIADDRIYSDIRNICVTRSWKPLYQNELLLSALSELPDADRLRVTFAGNPPANSLQIQEEMNQRHVDVEFTGPLDFQELTKLYCESDLYISAARSDGISVSLLEAMASGLICIVTDFPSNSEIIQTGINGFTFINGDAPSLVETIRRVVSLPTTKRQAIGRAAQKYVEERANWNRNSILMLDAILELVDVI